ncbi:hypothetical protein SAY87_014375 [Trapa incisa]|uniref:Uncharacterized protein n=1 Tax=Trapa incisa TaxID=236973 RepID=A0AAN7JKB3_9MYRT|nr:hypothetical protein SAY87_014375 [Trapa incisa]
MTLPNICRAKEISISRIDLHDVADHLRPEISGEKEKGRPDRSYLVGGGCRTTTWRSRTWSGTKSYRPTPTPAPAEIYSRSPRTIYVSGRRSPAVRAAHSTSPSSTTSRTSPTAPNGSEARHG